MVQNSTLPDHARDHAEVVTVGTARSAIHKTRDGPYLICRHGSRGGLVAAMAVNHIACTSSATLTRDHLAISKTSGTLAVHGAALAMDALSMPRGMFRPVRGAHKLAEFEAEVVRNFTPAFASFELPYDRVEALARCLGEQVCIFQASVAEPRR